MGITGKMKNAALNAAIQQALAYLEKDPETNIPKLMDLVDKLVPADWYSAQRAAFRRTIDKKDKWYQLIMKVYELDPEVRKTFFRNFILNASLLGAPLRRRRRSGRAVTCPGSFCWTPPPPATCTAPAAGPPSTATSST